MKFFNEVMPLATQLMAALLLGSCNNSQIIDGSNAEIDSITFIINPNNVSNISFFDHFSEIELIPLETTPESIIEVFDKVVYHEGTFYILDLKQATLFLFSEKGEFIDKIARKGSGPGEYQDLSDFNINEFTGNLELLDPWRKLLIFSPALEYIESIDIDQRIVHQFFNINKDTIVFYALSEDQKLSFFSRSQNNIFRKAFTYDKLEYLNLFPGAGFNIVFQRYNGRTLFTVPYLYEVFDVTNADLEHHRKLDFGKNNFKPENLEKGKDIFYHSKYYKNLKNEVFQIRYYFETDLSVFAMYVFNARYYSLRINKNSQHCDIVDRYQEGIGAVDIYTNIEDGRFFRVMNLTPEYLDAYMNILTEEQKKLVATISPEDNPGLIRYKIREHEEN